MNNYAISYEIMHTLNGNIIHIFITIRDNTNDLIPMNAGGLLCLGEPCHLSYSCNRVLSDPSAGTP